MSGPNPPPEVVFMLGAGASVKAGVPDTFGFVREFQESVEDPENRRTIDDIVAILQKWRPREVDVELLLETMTKLDSKQDEPLLKFYEGGRFTLGGYSEKRPILRALKDFIKKRAIIRSDDKVTYLAPLLGFVEAHRPLDIISLNYDTCVEQFCNVHRLDCQDGFDVSWNPQVFSRDKVDVRLYKLHGSVIWYKSDRAEYMKLPVMTERAGIPLIYGGTAESLMLYPMQKFDYVEPLLELLVLVKGLLQSEACKTLIVVGYSFRDDYIRRVVFDAARRNRDFTVVLVDPKALDIYQEKLKYFDDDSQISSSLDGRVVCLPYKFECALPFLKDQYLSQLRLGASAVSAWTRHERLGDKTQWVDCLRPLVKAEHVEKVEWLLATKLQEAALERDLELQIDASLRIGFNLAANGRTDQAQKWLEKLKDTLRRALVEGLQADVYQRGDRTVGIRFKFDLRENTFQSVAGLRQIFQEPSAYLRSRSKMLSSPERVQGFAFVASLAEHVGQLPEEVLFEKLVDLWKGRVRGDEIDNVKALIERWFRGEYTPQEQPSADIARAVTNIEKRVIESILIGS